MSACQTASVIQLAHTSVLKLVESVSAANRTLADTARNAVPDSSKMLTLALASRKAHVHPKAETLTVMVTELVSKEDLLPSAIATQASRTMAMTSAADAVIQCSLTQTAKKGR